MNRDFAFVASASVEPVLPGIWGLTPIAGMIGMIILLYWLLASGRIITRAQHDREIKFRDAIIERQDKTIERQNEQLGSLMSVAATIKAVLREATPGVLDEDTGFPSGGQA